jgi:hypothetical protein
MPLSFEPRRHVVVDGQGRSHIMMLGS